MSDEKIRSLQRKAREGDETAEAQLRREIARTTSRKIHYTLDGRMPRCGQIRGENRYHGAETALDTVAVDPSGETVSCRRCLDLMPSKQMPDEIMAELETREAVLDPELDGIRARIAEWFRCGACQKWTRREDAEGQETERRGECIRCRECAEATS